MILVKAAYVIYRHTTKVTMYLGKFVERNWFWYIHEYRVYIQHQIFRLKSVSKYINRSALVLLKLKTRYILFKANMFALAPQLGTPAGSMFKDIGNHICIISRARSSDSKSLVR